MEVALDCPHCKQKTYFALQRVSAYDTGFGCVNCGTAKEQKYICKGKLETGKDCKKEYSVYFQKEPYECLATHLCPDCLLREITANQHGVSIFLRKIPTWRLKIDDATTEQVLTAKSDTFGMPAKTHREWESYYKNTPYEREKMRKFNEQKKKDMREILS